MNKTTVWIITAIIIVLGLGFWWYSTRNTAPESTATDTQEEVAGAANNQGDKSKDGSADVSVGVDIGSAATISYTDSGFSPSTVTIKKGQSVTFVNRSTGDMWIGSDEHPSHTGYDGTNKDTHCASGYTGAKAFDQCGTGESYTFTFTKAGTWGYHNHRNDDAHGTIIVTE